jgi:hypothetical protein
VRRIFCRFVSDGAANVVLTALRHFVDFQISDQQNVEIQIYDYQNVKIQIADCQNIENQIANRQNIEISNC